MGWWEIRTSVVALMEGVWTVADPWGGRDFGKEMG